MGIASDLKMLYHIAFAKVGGKTHRERLDSFYAAQAEGYDDFRKRLLHGREEMMRSLPIPADGTLLDMGGGTGSNLEALPGLASLKRATVVDLCGPLLETARKRIAEKGWTNVDTALADVTAYAPEDGPVDAITFSYSLTMIPDWVRALEQAWALLKPGGVVGVADFYVSRKWPAAGMAKHTTFQRAFWPWWFGMDNVYPSPDHLPWLQSHFRQEKLLEGMGKVPYMPFRAPYYVFVGRKP
ncbi:MAG: class I SAM-dependent methyltransferase [Gemmataceae bacterium]|nr:class I SAM-dependent methyltransferase [Gemmataceae bacterium]